MPAVRKKGLILKFELMPLRCPECIVGRLARTLLPNVRVVDIKAERSFLDVTSCRGSVDQLRKRP